METADFDYELPAAAIAQTPVEPRDAARLLVDEGPCRSPRHGHVTDLPSLVGPGDVVVLNTTRVLPARLRLTKPTGGAVEVLLLEPVDPAERTWEALVRPSRKVAPGTALAAGDDLTVIVGDDLGEGRRRVELELGGGADLLGALDRHGAVPLPPYITTPLADPERYQTTYAVEPGSVAAPTAGLHLTPAVLDGVRAAGATVVPVELVVGLGTFRPIVTERVDDHEMHAERYRVPAETMAACEAAERVVAIGTTTVRALESAAARGELAGRTDLFIHGDRPFAVVNALVTNFHQPRSSLLVLVDAFIGPRWRDLYAEALHAGYRFLSFGDAMFLRGGASMTLSIEIGDRLGTARAGVIRTARGEIRTPCFMPVGTRGAVRTLSSADLEDLGAEIILGNTYHLMLKPGAERIARLGGLHGFADWRGHLLTDSGGYQVFSLDPGGNVRVDDDGVTFRSTYDGGTHRLTPASCVEIQTQLGSDIQMVLDVCAPLPSPPAVLREAVDRTAAWAELARADFLARDRADLNQFGIVQGGTDVDLRVESAQRTVAIGFDGYAVGGLSVGESRDAMLETLAATLPHLPDDQPRYLMGLGDPIGMVESIALGIDLFDCVLPTRFARHGTVLSTAGRYNLKRAENADDGAPLDDACGCPVCARWSRAYLRHLLVVDEPTAPRLLTIHNVWWTLRLVEEVRAAIGAGSLESVRSRVRGAAYE